MAINGIGRPSGYDDLKAKAICDRMSAGETLTQVCRDPDMPCRDTVYEWMDSRPDFTDAYARARDRMADAHFDAMIDEADLPDGATPAQVQAARLKVDTMKWTASRLRPAAYGDRLETRTQVDITVTHEHALAELDGQVLDGEVKLIEDDS